MKQEKKKILLDLSKMTRRIPAHEYLQKKLDFPDYYGKNLDALSDCLSELGPCHIVFMQSEEIPEGSYAHKVIREIQEATEMNPNITFALPSK